MTSSDNRTRRSIPSSGSDYRAGCCTFSLLLETYAEGIRRRQFRHDSSKRSAQHDHDDKGFDF